jgi:hypothetical protein
MDPTIHRSPPGRLRRRVLAALGHGPKGVDDAAWLGSAVTAAELRAAADAGGLDLEAIAHEGTPFAVPRLRRRT